MVTIYLPRLHMSSTYGVGTPIISTNGATTVLQVRVVTNISQQGRHNLIPGSAGTGMYGLQSSAPADFIRRGFAARTNSRASDGLLVRF